MEFDVIKDFLHMLSVFVFQLWEQRHHLVVLTEPKVQYLERDFGADLVLVSNLSNLPSNCIIFDVAELRKILLGFNVYIIVDVVRAHVAFALLVEPLSLLLVLVLNDFQEVQSFCH